MNIGDYVRTKYGITQYKEYETANGNKLLCMPVKDGSNGIFANIEDIIKSSPNIIDLIEKFDLVNGHLVICKMYENEKDIPTIVKCVGDYYFKEEDIKSIVTKEQFESMKYEVGDKE